MPQPLVYMVLSLSASGVVTNLLAAIQAADPRIQGSYREVNLQGDPGNATNNIALGDDQLAGGRYGFVLVAGANRTYRQSGSGMAGVPIANIYFAALSGAPRLNVELMM